MLASIGSNMVNLLSNPETQEKANELLSIMTQDAYNDLILQLGITDPEIIKKLQSALLEHRIRMLEDMTLFTSGAISMDDWMKARNQAPIRQEIQDLLGEGALAKFNQYEREQPSRDVFNKVIARAALQGYAYSLPEREALVGLLNNNSNSSITTEQLLQITTPEKAKAFQEALTTESRLKNAAHSLMSTKASN
jgi:hypothetical protein